MRFKWQEAAGFAVLKSEKENYSDGTSGHKWKVSLGCCQRHLGGWWQMVLVCRDKRTRVPRRLRAKEFAQEYKKFWGRRRQYKLM